LTNSLVIDLQGKVALVTGGSRGIGAACCRMLARAGCDVGIGYRTRADAAARVVRDVEAEGRRAVAIPGDLAHSMAATAAVEQTVAELGRLDILVANAGIWTGVPVETMTDADLARMLAVNLSSAFYLARAAGPRMRESGGGSIVFVASTAGQRGEAGHSHYAASKGGVLALVKSLAVELGPEGIRVNAVAPGWIRTDMTEESLRPENIGEALKEPIPLGAPGEPEDVAGAVVFLASSLARHITGATINVNGGAVLT
jgi:3-oxoacyl-[acyl-carrier protein] reductase